jgi:membrane protein implicated in regulation of membrane protease activity
MDNVFVRIIAAVIVAALIVVLIPWRFDWAIAVLAAAAIIFAPYARRGSV